MPIRLRREHIQRTVLKIKQAKILINTFVGFVMFILFVISFYILVSEIKIKSYT